VVVKNERYDLYDYDGKPKPTPLRYRKNRSIVADQVKAIGHAVITFKPLIDQNFVEFVDLQLFDNSTFVEPHIPSKFTKYIIKGQSIGISDGSHLIMGNYPYHNLFII
jgi:hypothetical protein